MICEWGPALTDAAPDFDHTPTCVPPELYRPFL